MTTISNIKVNFNKSWRQRKKAENCRSEGTWSLMRGIFNLNCLPNFVIKMKLSFPLTAHINSSASCQKAKPSKEIKTHFAREAGERKKWRNYNEKQFGEEEGKKWRMEASEKERNSLLLHYDKHENNFPPIFSIKIIAFFACCAFHSSETLPDCWWRARNWKANFGISSRVRILEISAF